MKLTFKDGRFVCYCRYEEKDIPKKAGFMWDPNKKQWWTDTYTIAARLRKLADNAAQNEFARQAGEIKKSMAKDAFVLPEIPTPEGLELMPFQKIGVQFALERKHTLIADSMGLGKTIQAIGVMNVMKPVRVLIICPASLKLNWERELKRWLISPYNIRIIDSNDSFVWKENEIVIVNYERITRPQIKTCLDINFDLLVVDECHKVKNPQAQRTIAVFDLFRRAGKAVFLTGTPMPNRPVELFSLLHAAFPERWDRFMPFAKRYCGAYQDQYGWHFDGASNLEELHTWLRAHFMIRRTKEEVLSELPDKIRQIIPISAIGRDIAKLLEKEHEYFESVLTQHNVSADNLHFVLPDVLKQLFKSKTTAGEEDHIMRIRHQLALAKVSYTCDYINEVLEEVPKLVVFAHHRDVLEKLHESFHDSVLLYGGMSDQQKQAAVDRFQNDPACRIFFGSIQAAGLGFTLTAANHVIFHELDFVTGNMIQAEDRCHRIGQKHSVLIQFLVFDGSLDEKILRILQRKSRWATKTLDDAGWAVVGHREIT